LGPSATEARDQADDAASLKAKGLGATKIARRLKIGRASVYRKLEGV
jgi:hypothetical protein